MNIAGIGVVFARGRGIDCYDNALDQGWVYPQGKGLDSLLPKAFRVYRVDDESMVERMVLKKMRRADRLSKMAALAAWDAIEDGGVTVDAKQSRLGIIVATAFGPHVTTFRFLDDILDYGENSVSPTVFSHSVHNAAASYIALVLGIRGPALTISQFGFSFHQALVLAQAWVQEGRCENVLVGSVDECGTVMEYICSRKLRIAEDGKIKPFNCAASPEAVPGEGSVFFLMTGEEYPRRYCEISAVALSHGQSESGNPDIYIIDADGMSGDERKYRKIGSDVMVCGYAPVFGSMMTGSAFHCAAGALMLKKQIRYACPVQDNPYEMNVCTITEHVGIDEIRCVRYGCTGEKAEVKLKL